MVEEIVGVVQVALVGVDVGGVQDNGIRSW